MATGHHSSDSVQLRIVKRYNIKISTCEIQYKTMTINIVKILTTLKK